MFYQIISKLKVIFHWFHTPDITLEEIFLKKMMDDNVDNSNEEETPADIKLIIVGDSAVGKSKLLER